MNDENEPLYTTYILSDDLIVSETETDDYDEAQEAFTRYLESERALKAQCERDNEPYAETTIHLYERGTSHNMLREAVITKL